MPSVSDREHFHTDRYCFPPGYVATRYSLLLWLSRSVVEDWSRTYNSMIDPHAQTTYTNKILEFPDGPRFQVLAADQPGEQIIAGTPTGAWSMIVKKANAIGDRISSNSVSGPEYYGLGSVIVCTNIICRLVLKEL